MDSIGILCNDAAMEEGAVLARRVLQAISGKFAYGEMKVVFILYSLRSTPKTAENVYRLEELGRRYKVQSKVEAVEAGRIEEVAEGIAKAARGLLTVFVSSAETELIEALRKSGLRLEISEVPIPAMVSSLMSRNVFTLPPGTSVLEAARKTCEKDVGCIVVAEGGQVLGIVTRQDIIKVFLGFQDPAAFTLGEIMASPAICTDSGADIVEVSRVMREKKVKRLPVMEGGRLVGIVSVTDFLKVPPRHREKIWQKLVELTEETASPRL